MSEFAGTAERIVDDAPYIAAAEELGCDPAAVRAVAEVESRGEPFLADNRPRILFERHVFSRRTDRQHDAADPDISNRTPGGYRGGAAEYERLERAIALDRPRALESASWGEFQIMGFNHRVCGFPTVEDFCQAMGEAQALQLDAFVTFVKTNRLDRHLRALDWAGFARGYNGPTFRINEYDLKMAQAHARLAGEIDGVFRVADLRDLQTALNFLGADAGAVDGLMGPRTRGAILRFQRQTWLAQSGEPSPAVMQAAQAVYYALDGPPTRAAS